MDTTTNINKIKKIIEYSLNLKNRIEFYFKIIFHTENIYSFKDLQELFEILYNNGIDVNIWLVNRVKYHYSEQTNIMDPDDNISYGLQKAKLFYLKYLINKFDNEYNFKDHGLFNIYSEIVEDNIVKYNIHKGFYYDYNLLMTTDKIKETLIVFPMNFDRFTIDDLIESINNYVTKEKKKSINNYDILFKYKRPISSYIHTWLKTKFHLINNKEIIERFNRIIDRYNFIRTKRRLELYEEELIQKTWKPNRLFTWCFDEEEKKDFQYTIN